MFDKELTGEIGQGQLKYSKCLPPVALLCYADAMQCKAKRNEPSQEPKDMNVLTISLPTVLTNLGEPLTEAEFEELAKATNMGEKVQYEDLVKTILAN